MRIEEHNELKNLLKILSIIIFRERTTDHKKNRFFMVRNNYIFINIVLYNLESIINHKKQIELIFT
jgi:hypothetical protein